MYTVILLIGLTDYTNDLGLNLINQFKAQDMEIMETYDTMDQFIDTEAYMYEDFDE